MEVVETSQLIFDNFNSFIFSKDTKIFGKLMARILLLNKVKDIPGDVIECGVFKGSGLFTLLKAKKFLFPNSVKKVIGMDFFDNEILVSELKGIDKEQMEKLFKNRNFSNKDYDEILKEKIVQSGFEEKDFLLIKGDLSITSKKLSNENPGLKISFLYMDVDLEEPTYNTLINLWENISVGGIVIFDEYGYHCWSESRGVDKFVKEKNIKIHTLDYLCPTAYIIKN